MMNRSPTNLVLVVLASVLGSGACDKASGDGSAGDGGGGMGGGGGTTSSGEACVPYVAEKPADDSVCPLPCGLTFDSAGPHRYCTITCPDGAPCPEGHTCFDIGLGVPTCLLACEKCPDDVPCQGDCPEDMLCAPYHAGTYACDPD